MIPARALELGGIAVIYLVLAKLGLKLALINPSASPVWPATGFALAMILLRGHRIWPAVFIAALIANATTAGSLLTSAVIASGNALEALIGGHLITRFCHGTRAFDTPIRVAKFALISIGPAALISATIGVSALRAGGFVEPGQFSSVWMTWWMGDSASALLLTPVMVLWAVSGSGTFDRKELTITAMLLAAASAAGLIVFTPLAAAAVSRAPIGFLAMVPLLCAALRRGPRDTATVALVLACFATWGAARAEPAAPLRTNEALLLVSMFVIGAALPSLALSAEVALWRQAESALRESEERLRLSNEAAGIGTFDIDAEAGRIVYSPELAAMLGFPGVRTARLEDAFARVHRDDLSRVRTLHDAGLRGAGDGKIKVDFRFVPPGGEIRWMTWAGRVYFREEPAGRVPFRVTGACVDITERKRHEEQINLLLREVNHRSKNMLTIVQAIARQTVAANPHDFIERFTERIQALAASQDLLVKNEWRGVDLDELVRSQLGPFKDLVDKRIELHGPPLLISASAAQVLGMALHELATNAGKYGALSNDSGRVEGGWSLEPGEDGGKTFVISWRERGGPVLTPPASSGFGSTVLCQVAKESLDAQVELSYASTGLVWRLQCPAQEVVETGRSA